ncbi:hypothetical protein BHM03_00019086 [Ensete ventricosum]|nr:hypothetical protein BHM03_00019086 [Ensete ventricosum]
MTYAVSVVGLESHNKGSHLAVRAPKLAHPRRSSCSRGNLNDDSQDSVLGHTTLTTWMDSDAALDKMILGSPKLGFDRASAAAMGKFGVTNALIRFSFHDLLHESSACVLVFAREEAEEEETGNAAGGEAAEMEEVDDDGRPLIILSSSLGRGVWQWRPHAGCRTPPRPAPTASRTSDGRGSSADHKPLRLLIPHCHHREVALLHILRHRRHCTGPPFPLQALIR